MTNNLTGLTALIVAISGLVTGIGTLILHLRSRSNVKSQATTQQPPPASANDLHAENQPYNPAS